MAEKVKVMQKNDRKSIGAEIDFEIKEINKKIKIFTTRPDTIYGASFIAISVNHQIVTDLINKSELTKIKDQFNGIDTKRKNRVH